jgi:spermidine synthase
MVMNAAIIAAVDRLLGYAREHCGEVIALVRKMVERESPSDDAAAVRRIHKQIVLSFPLSRLYQAHIPTYPSGHWLFGFSSKQYHPVQHLDAERWNARRIETRYYNTNLHKAAFALPTYVEDLIKDVE